MIHSWLAVDKNRKEHWFTEKPIRGKSKWETENGTKIAMVDGGIEKLTNKKISWKDEPIEYLK